MQTVGAFNAKTHFSELLQQVEKGEHVIITKHGHPVAKLIPVSGIDRPGVQHSIQRLKEFGKHNILGGLDWKSLRDEGRK